MIPKPEESRGPYVTVAFDRAAHREVSIAAAEDNDTIGNLLLVAWKLLKVQRDKRRQRDSDKASSLAHTG